MVDCGDDEMRTPKVSKYMTRNPIFLSVPGKRREAMKIFVQDTVSGVPVLREDDDKIVGIVTRANVFNKPHEDQLAMIMQKDVLTCRQDDNLTKATRLMTENNVHRLPVLDKEERLVGMISPIDILPFIEELELTDTVEKVMRMGVVPLYRLIPANVAIEIMTLSGAKALPVLNDEGRVEGILTDRDIFAQVSIDQKMVETDLGPASEKDAWSSDRLGNIMKLYYDTGKIKIPSIPIEEFMVKEPVTVQAKATVSKVAKMLHRGRFNQLPVVDMDDHLSGMVFDLDLLSVLL